MSRIDKKKALYISKDFPGIQMSAKAAETKEDFIRLWSKTSNAKGADLNKEWTKYRIWRNKNK